MEPGLVPGERTPEEAAAIDHPDNGRVEIEVYQYSKDSIQDENSDRPMTHHGLRHSFAARTYQTLTEGNATPLQASLQASRLLGHERADVTRGYLASIKKGGDGNG